MSEVNFTPLSIFRFKRVYYCSGGIELIPALPFNQLLPDNFQAIKLPFNQTHNFTEEVAMRDPGALVVCPNTLDVPIPKGAVPAGKLISIIF